ncbi:MAG: L,D-transpeptidase [Methylobacteriaceae bacterium]|nr:L,D-transpeptidase [Methylobacteriaceae bacterium]
MRILSLLIVLLASLGLARPASAAVDIRVDLTTQTMRVTSSTTGESHVWPVSTARAGYVTPRGVYRAQRLVRMHYSRKYDMSPMPHSIFFRGGYAIHGTGAVKRLGTPASHGCVRLAPANAAKLFSMVKQEGARIAISGESPRSTMLAKASPKKSKTVLASKSAASKSLQAARRASPTSALGFAPLRGPLDPGIDAWLRHPTRR